MEAYEASANYHEFTKDSHAQKLHAESECGFRVDAGGVADSLPFSEEPLPPMVEEAINSPKSPHSECFRTLLLICSALSPTLTPLKLVEPSARQWSEGPSHPLRSDERVSSQSIEETAHVEEVKQQGIAESKLQPETQEVEVVPAAPHVDSEGIPKESKQVPEPKAGATKDHARGVHLRMAVTMAFQIHHKCPKSRNLTPFMDGLNPTQQNRGWSLPASSSPKSRNQ